MISYPYDFIIWYLINISNGYLIPDGYTLSTDAYELLLFLRECKS